MPSKEMNSLQPLKLGIRHLASHTYSDLNITLKIFMLCKSSPSIRRRNSNHQYVKLCELFHIEFQNSSSNVNLEVMAIRPYQSSHWNKAIWTRAGSVCPRTKTIHKELRIDFCVLENCCCQISSI